MASTKLNMKATRISTCDTPTWISRSDAVPRSRASVTSRSIPNVVSSTLTIVSASRTHRVRRRAASATVSRAMVRTAFTTSLRVERAGRRPAARRRPFPIAQVSESPAPPASAPTANSRRKRSSSVARPPSTAWTRPPAATIAATTSGIVSGSSGLIVSQSSST